MGGEDCARGASRWVENNSTLSYMKYFTGLFVVASLLSSTSQAQSLTPLKVVVVVPLTGLIPGPALEISNAAKMAVSDARADFKNLGYDLRLEVFDDRSNVDEIKSIAKKVLADRSVMAVVGALNSGLCVPLNELLAPSHVAVVSPICAANAVTDKGLSNVNRLVARNDDIGNVAARFMVRVLKITRVVAIDDGTVFGTDFSRSVQSALKSSNTPVLDAFTAPKLDEYPAAVARIVKSQTELVNLGFSGYEAMSNFIKELRKQGYKGEVMCSATFGGPEVVNLLRQDLPGILYASYGGPLDAYSSLKIPGFGRRYTRLYKNEATFYSLLGYDSTRIVLEGLRQSVQNLNRALPDRLSVEQNVRKQSLQDALSGPVSFNSVGDRSEATVYVMRYGDDFKPRLVAELPAKPPKL